MRPREVRRFMAERDALHLREATIAYQEAQQAAHECLVADMTAVLTIDDEAARLIAVVREARAYSNRMSRATQVFERARGRRA